MVLFLGSGSAAMILLLCLLALEVCLSLRFHHHAMGRSASKTVLRSASVGKGAMGSDVSAGTIALVGAGPGDPEMLTMQAMKYLKNASLVIADRLISKEILDLIKCELRIAKKRPGCAEEAQEEIYHWVVEAVRQGKNVVRLKIGDPLLFGRGGEEFLYFKEQLGIVPVIVPGISSSYSAPMAALIPLTHRGVSNQVLISTGYGKDLAYVEVPVFVQDRTVVLLMAVGRIGEIAADLVARKNYPLSTPVAIVESATTPQQRTLLGTLETIGDIAAREEAKAPATIVIGNVVNVLM